MYVWFVFSVFGKSGRGTYVERQPVMMVKNNRVEEEL
jgi:hypothetical protein